jgi:flagellar biosynthetic protein FliR
MTATTLLVFSRAAGLVFRAPGFSHPSVPAPVRAAFAVALALSVAPAVRDAHVDGPALAVAAAGDFLLGASIGMGATVLYDGAYYAGRSIDDYVGVRGSVPSANVTSAQAFGRLWSSVFLAGFFLLDGYVPVVRAFAASFAAVAPGALVAPGDWMHFALALPAAIVQTALIIAAPAIGVAFAIQVAFAAIARVVPRLANFSLAFPVVFAAAVIVTIVGVPLLAPWAAHPVLLVPFGGLP